MAGMEALQAFSNVTNINQLSLNANNQIEIRSGLGAFFRGIGDFFLGLSQSGRAEIIDRNERIINAMQTNVREAMGQNKDVSGDLATRIGQVQRNLKQAVSSTKTAMLNEVLQNLNRDTRFQGLPPMSQDALVSALRTTADNNNVVEWKAKMDAIKSSFMEPHSKNYDPKLGMQQFKERMIESFLLNEQQVQIENGIHASFNKDTGRRAIHSFLGQTVPEIGDAAQDSSKWSPDQVRNFSAGMIRELLGPDNQDLLPFVTMMTSQAGMDSAMLLFSAMSKQTSELNQHLLDAGLITSKTLHSLHVDKVGDKLTITANFEQNLHTMLDMKTPVLSLGGTLTMEIDLAAKPTEHQVTVTHHGNTEERTVLIPQFKISGGESHFHTNNVPR